MTLFTDHFKLPGSPEKKLNGPPEKTVLASFSSIDSSKWELSLHKFDFFDALKDDLQTLSDASGDRNVFFDPAFLSASQERLGLAQKRILILSEELGDTAVMKMAMPVQLEKVGFPGQNVWRVWSHPFAPLSTPLVVGDEMEDIVSKFCQLLPLIESKRASAFLFQDLPVEGAFMRALQKERCFAERMIVHGQSERAALLSGSPETYMSTTFSKKHARELRRQKRKVEKLGELEFEIATDFWKVMVRFEEFLLLETKSWKGRRGTSIHVIKRTAAFARQAIANLINYNNCRVYSLRLDGKSISSMIVLKSGNRYFPWKMAFDEDYNNYSVGKQLAVLVSQDLLTSSEFEGADSLATSDNRLMNSIWFDRLQLCNLTIGLGENDSEAKAQAETVAEAVDRKARIKGFAKTVLGKLR
ncbi:MAG: GNAT family N-acetyltransferase [Rhizobiaceae bacterium]|nr:GNAT family N-acetyltransferase [Rhizobiaceae bacterium]